jgi:fucose permease
MSTLTISTASKGVFIFIANLHYCGNVVRLPDLATLNRQKRRPPVEAASKFLLVPAPVIAIVPRIVGVVAMMVVVMMVAVIAMMVVVMMVAVPGCSWDRAANSDCADNA